MARLQKAVALALGLVLCAAIAPSATASSWVVRDRAAGMVTADVLPTVQIDGVVWTQVVIGDTVYAGGKFSYARPAGASPKTQQVRRYNLLAYNLRTGELVRSFAPNVNGSVKTLAASPDGKTLYLGGSFTKVNGVGRGYFAALSVPSGKLSALRPKANRSVSAIIATSTRVYFGGDFTTVDGRSRSRLAAVWVSSRRLTSWVPKANAEVKAMTMTTDRRRVVAGGYFSKLNTTTAPGMGALDPTTGKTLGWKINTVVKDHGTKSAILSLVADGDLVFGSGYSYGGGNFEGVFAARQSDGAVHWLQDCHGDTYSVAPIGDAVYSVGHAHHCENIGGFPDTSPRSVGQSATAVTRSAQSTVRKNSQLTTVNGKYKYTDFAGQPAPTMYSWFPDIAAGSYTGQAQGAWSVTGTSEYLLLGGEFPSVNGIAQQGLGRMAIPRLAPNAQGPRDKSAATAPRVEHLGGGKVRVSWPANWDRDDRKLTYELVRRTSPPCGGCEQVVDTQTADSAPWDRPTLSYTDSVGVGRVAYAVRVADADGNTITSEFTSYPGSTQPPT